MADNNHDGEDRTEEATPERREEFREKGHVAMSREVTSVFALAAATIYLSFYLPDLFDDTRRLLITHLQTAGQTVINDSDYKNYAQRAWREWLVLSAPIFFVVFGVSAFLTLLQTRFNWSWKKLSPDFKRLNPLTGLMQMVNMQALLNLVKGLGKMFAVCLVTYLILYSEWVKLPGLMNVDVPSTWTYWADITKMLFWGVAAFLLVIGGGDYLYNFLTFEKKLKMTKQEVKEDLKRREVDPYVKGRMKKMQRDMAFAKMVTGTKKATVLITNPTHFSVALQYEPGMQAPMVVAKGRDFNALHMRQIAKEHDIPIVENKPLARTLYKVVEVGHYIPESLYKAASEVIRYVFKLKGRKIPTRPARAAT